jgi:probable addiction module antidote protein
VHRRLRFPDSSGTSATPTASTKALTGRERAARPNNELADASLLAAALGDIARARGMTEIAKSAGITREALYKALRPESAPRFDTVRRVCAALGVRLVVQPAHP